MEKKYLTIKLKIEDLHPTQFCVGLLEIEEKFKKYQKMSHSEFDDLMKDKSVPVVLGPDDKIYLIDRHHNVSTFMKMGVKETYAHVMADFRRLTTDQFWQVMKICNWTWLKDENHKDREPQDLPHKLSKLVNDPYRSLTYLLRESKVLNKDEAVPFIEFSWAEIIREKVKVDKDNIDQSFIKTLKLLLSGDLIIKDSDLNKAKEVYESSNK